MTQQTFTRHVDTTHPITAVPYAVTEHPEHSCTARLLVLLAAQAGAGVGDADVQLGGTLDNGLALEHRHVVSNLGAETPAEGRCAEHRTACSVNDRCIPGRHAGAGTSLAMIQNSEDLPHKEKTPKLLCNWLASVSIGQDYKARH